MKNLIVWWIVGTLAVAMLVGGIWGEKGFDVLKGLFMLAWFGWLGFQLVALCFKDTRAAVGVGIGIVVLILFVKVIMYVGKGTIGWFGWLFGHG